ncbi:hypothetical protein Aph01nite_08220 [Acrocarpospora phusangensis]|uniref:Uncharacterized protein n=1 Tax=Acrocarpospora phusangensis TaxID=1070424 RepID=A0A919Q9X2_9ACTN|nr:hypothetical protein [Acrocarpospora phusangensis]GIH22512.1 hypothetical protein Aph01nite_08220 [Acrocarpospora phusangensis]
MADIFLRPGEVALDDNHVIRAMVVYDVLKTPEQREIFRSTYRAVTAFKRTGDIDHLVRFANSIETMILLDGDPATRQAILDAPDLPVPDADLHDVQELIKELQE